MKIKDLILYSQKIKLEIKKKQYNDENLFSLLRYNDLFSNNFPWEKIHFKNFSKEKCIQYFNQLIPNETVFNNKIKIINEEKNNNIIGISLNDNILDLNSDNGDDIKNMIEIKIDNDPKEENLTFEEYNQQLYRNIIFSYKILYFHIDKTYIILFIYYEIPFK